MADQDVPGSPTIPAQAPLGDAAARRHLEQELGDGVAAVTDLGRRHHTNQDAFALASLDGGGTVLAVSDGVSTSWGAERSSLTAASAVRDHLVRALSQASGVDAVEQALRQGYLAAQQAVLGQGEDGSAVGSCTLVVAVLRGPWLSVANVGDTRSYWVPDDGATQQLTVDDSLAQAQMEFGLSREEAESSPHAHAITRWLGPGAPEVAPHTASTRLEAPGWVVVCSDGLWNDASSAEALGELVHSLAPGHAQAVDLARALVEWANARGGRDNITVALARAGDPPATR